MVSVCMATYNGEDYIYEQLASIINQIGQKDEIIVSDDGSTDHTLDIVKSFNDSRITIHQVNYKSPAKNFENAISNATGDYIFLADQDDIWFDNKVEVCLSLLKQYDVVVTDCSIINKKGVELAPSLYRQIGAGKGVFKNLLSNSYYGCCMCFTRKVVSLIFPFPAHIPMHDVWIGFVSDCFLKVCFDKNVLVKYRRHDKNVTFITKSKASLFVKIGRRLNLIRYFPLLVFRMVKHKIAN